MTFATIRLKIPRELKARIARLTESSGLTTNAFVLRALENEVEAGERRQDFLAEGVRADRAMLRSGLGYTATDVHTYLDAKVKGSRPRRPRAIRARD